MAIPLPDLASKLGFSEVEMEKHILELGFEVEKEIEDDIAELIIDELSGKTEKSEADVYEDLAEEEREKEIIKSQRKKKAGKVTKKKKGEVKETKVAGGEVEIPENISVKELAEKTGVSAAMLIGGLMKNGILANINQVIDFDTAVIITDGLKVKLKKALAEATAEDVYRGNL